MCMVLEWSVFEEQVAESFCGSHVELCVLPGANERERELPISEVLRPAVARLLPHDAQ